MFSKLASISALALLRSKFLLALSIGLMSLDANVAEETAEQPDVVELVAQLGSNLPEVRDEAQRKLLETGLPALEAVAQMSNTGSPGTAARGWKILYSWLDSPDAALKSNVQKKVLQLVSEWIAQLDDDLYAVRKNAQQRLELAGLPALEAVATEASTGTLESSTRALNVMLAWGESADHELQVAALEKLVTLSNRPTEANQAAELLADAREQVALKALVNLGASYRLDIETGGVLPNGQPGLHVMIDENWKGELADLELISSVRSATTVSFYSISLDERILEHLKELPYVRRVQLIGTGISEESKVAFENQRPAVKVDFRRSAALLGITGDPFLQGPVMIRTVSQGSAAEKAGLQKDDAVTELDGEKVRDFRDLTERIGKYQPGETVELTIKRDEKLLKKEVTFHRWSNEAWAKNAQAIPNPAARPARPVPRSPSLDRR